MLSMKFCTHLLKYRFTQLLSVDNLDGYLLAGDAMHSQFDQPCKVHKFVNLSDV